MIRYALITIVLLVLLRAMGITVEVHIPAHVDASAAVAAVKAEAGRLATVSEDPARNGGPVSKEDYDATMQSSGAE